MSHHAVAYVHAGPAPSVGYGLTQLERLTDFFEPALEPMTRLPWPVSFGVVIGGAILGWAVPIAMVWSFVR